MSSSLSSAASASASAAPTARPLTPLETSGSGQFQNYLYNGTAYPYRTWEQLGACMVTVPALNNSTGQGGYNETKHLCEDLAGTANNATRSSTQRYYEGSGANRTASDTAYYCFVPTYGSHVTIMGRYQADGRSTLFCQAWGGFGSDGKRQGPNIAAESPYANTTGTPTSGAERSVGWAVKGAVLAGLLAMGVVL